MKVAILGGRFDPIHNGHLAVAKEVLKIQAADEVWFSLEHQHQWRPIVASIADRFAMLRLAIADTSFDLIRHKIKIDDTPIKLGGLTETISVMRKLRQDYPEKTFLFVCGSDQPFDKWTHWDMLQKEVQFLIVYRKNFVMDHIPSNCILIEDPTYEPLEDSATRIRNLLKEGKSIHGLVSTKVEEYIREHKLYL